MTSHQPQPQEEQSPQRSTSGYPLQEVVDDEVSGPSAPGVDPSPPRRSLGCKRKRECLDESDDEPEKELAPEPEETWVAETLCGLKMKAKRRRVSLVLPEYYEAFNRLLAPGVDPSPPRRSLGCKRKRECLDESDDEPEKELAPEPEETWVAETLCGLKMKAKRRRVSLVLPEYYEAFNRLLAPGVDPSPPRRSLGCKRKRECLDESDDEPEKELAPEPEETWVAETLCGLKMKAKRRRVSLVLPEYYEAFNRLLAPGVDPSPPRRSLGCKRKRECLDESDDEPEKELAPEPEETWVAETLCGLKMKAKRRRVSLVLPEYYEAFNRLLAPGVDPSPPRRSLGCKRKRECLDESDDEPEKELAPEPEETWVAETLCGLKMKAKRRRVSLVLPEYYEAFNRLLEDPVIKRFLAWDKGLRVSDKYLLAMVIAYFSRAGLPSWQYQRIHFFLALYLANDMEEDDEAPKQKIFYFLYGKTHSHIPLRPKHWFQLCRPMNPRARKNCSQIALFQKRRFQFFCSMRCRAWVSPEELEEIQAYDPEHWVWARDRAHLS
nr:SPDYE3 protein [Homo sapiens]